MKIYSDKNASLREIRQLLHCSQEEMASFLNVHRTTIAMVESGHRGLPSSALVHLNELKVWVQKATDDIMSSKVEAFELKKKELAHLKALKMKLLKSLLRQRKKLLLMQDQYSESIVVQSLLERMEVNTTGALRLRHKRWHSALIAHQHVKQQSCGLESQMRLKTSIAGMEKELAFLSTHL